MTPHEVATSISNGVAAGLVLIALWMLADRLLFPRGTGHNLAQLIANAWQTRPRHALSRTRRNRPQGPGN
jgi:hypothetical protein